MKKITSHILSLTLLFASTAFAGTYSYSKSSKAVTTSAPPECPCFGPGFDLGIFGGGFFPRDRRDSYDDEAGGGALAEYFFTENIGIQVSYGAFATDEVSHVINGDLILRAPIHSICLAPYLMVGGGVLLDGSNDGDFHAGAGIEVKFDQANCFGIFADGAYHWIGGDNDKDFTLVRVGVKFHL